MTSCTSNSQIICRSQLSPEVLMIHECAMMCVTFSFSASLPCLTFDLIKFDRACNSSLCLDRMLEMRHVNAYFVALQVVDAKWTWIHPTASDWKSCPGASLLGFLKESATFRTDQMINLSLKTYLHLVDTPIFLLISIFAPTSSILSSPLKFPSHSTLSQQPQERM